MSFTQAEAVSFARSFLQMNPLYLNEAYAKAHGFPTLPLSPQLVFNAVLSLGVQNDSEKVMANLGYYNAQFLQPVYPGDTLEALTQVIDRKERGADKPGIVTIRTLGLNQHKQVVLQYERKLMVAYQGDRPDTTPLPENQSVEFPWVTDAQVNFPDALISAIKSAPRHLTGHDTYASDFKPGDIIVHSIGRTITEEHMNLTYQVGNTHPLHFDQVFSQGLAGKMSGKPIVYGGLVYAWLEGLSSRDVAENAVWELGFHEGYHTQPAFAGDTVAPITRVLSNEDAPGELSDVAAVVSLQMIGVKNVSAKDAWEAHGADLFIKESDKKALGMSKIESKVFEIERRLLIKK